MEKSEITAAQIRAARALLSWQGHQLAAASGVSLSTIRRLETGVSETGALAMRAIVAALEAAGIEFIPGGARVRPEASE